MGDFPRPDLKELVKTGRKALSEGEAKALLRSYGILTPDFEVISDFKAEGFRFPLAVKVNSPDILHKTEKGGVFLNVNDPIELRRKFIDLRERFPEASVLVEPMERGEVEVIIGLVKDPVFGMAIMFGMGGVFTELYQDIVFRMLPITETDAEEMLEGVIVGRLLHGFRGIKADREAVKRLLLRVSALGEELGQYIGQMDLNPVMVSERGCVVVDAKVVLEKG
jgi:acyl-CoA synthetase (NDP forming)